MEVKFIAIAALGKNREIGLEGKLPWNIPDEYQHYKNTIKGHYVLVSRKNFQLNGSVIEEAMPLVLSRTPFSHPGAVVLSSMDDLANYVRDREIEKIYVIGGSEIYRLTLPYISEFICSAVDYEGPADTYFPEYLFYEWEVINQEIHKDWTLYHFKKRPERSANTRLPGH